MALEKQLIFGILGVVLLVVWGVSVRFRGIYAGLRRYLLSIAFLMGFWMAARVVKWDFAGDPDVRRWLWYLYYLAIVMIPQLFLYLAVSVGKPETYRLPSGFRLAFGLGVLLFLLVMTNDLHQMVFVFPKDSPVWSDESYRYGPGYYVVAAWAVVCGLAALPVMIQKARVLKVRTLLLSVLSFGFLFLYSIVYALRLVPRIYPLYDMVFIFCLCFTMILEGCIRSGLIPSNTHYTELFGLSAIDGQIADKQFHTLLASGSLTSLSEQVMRRTVTEPVEIEKHIRLVSAPIKAGYVVWKEDISEISEILEELEEKGEYLTGQKTVLQKEVETSHREQMLAEKNRLYDALMRGTQGNIECFEGLLDQMEQEEDPTALAALTKRLALVCTHLKRRSNLIFLAQQDGRIEAGELMYALEEWISALKLGGTACGCAFDVKTPAALSDMLFLYDTLQNMLLYTVDTLQSFFVNCMERDGKPLLRVSITCGADLLQFAAPGVRLSDREGDEWVLEIGR